MKDSLEFGVILSRESNDPKMFETYNIGTMAKIIDWEQGNDGLLGITFCFTIPSFWLIEVLFFILNLC